MRRQQTKTQSKNKYAMMTIVLAGVGLTLAVLFAFVQESRVAYALASVQQSLHQLLSMHIQDVRQNEPYAGWLLLGLSFLYGLFHAIGPGHGKAIIVGYLSTQDKDIRYGLSISFASALLQSIVAIAIVSMLYLFFALTLGAANNIGSQLELASYWLIGCVGLLMLYRAKQRWRARQIDSHGHRHDHGHKHDHGHESDHSNCHHVHTATVGTLKESILLIISMGARPCTGALIVLMYAYIVGLYAYGIAATLAMGAGTGLAIGALAFIVIRFREMLKSSQWLKQKDAHSHQSFFISAVMGLLLIVLSYSLITAQAALNPVNHPLF